MTEEDDELTREELMAALALQELESDIKKFKTEFRWREARVALYRILRRNIPRGHR